jgi:DNA polymerase I-like protein with 3'-5' exonuclease and polymerase domains
MWPWSAIRKAEREGEQMQKQWEVVDVETTMRCPIGTNKASAFWPHNEIVMAGAYDGMTLRIVSKEYSPPKMMVGNNITFDVHHLLKGKYISERQLEDTVLWDTQLAEYLLSGQQTKMASLDELSEMYGGVPKNKAIVEHFASGKGADTVNPEQLWHYLQDDLRNTALVFKNQLERAVAQGMLPLIMSQMDALLATCMAAYHGMQVDVPMLVRGLEDAYEKLKTLKDTCDKNIAKYTMCDVSIDSPQQLSALLFGGVVPRKVKIQKGFYKNGKAKFVNETLNTTLKGLFKPLEGASVGANGFYSTDEATLKDLRLREPSSTPAYSLLEDILAYREHAKQTSTYWEGITKLVFPDNRIHPTFNHAVTVTGRLSSSAPNMQNITNGDIKKVFVSRFGEHGRLVEVDYKQLEMVELATLSGDKQLLDDISTGRDMHNELFKSMYGRAMKPEERKKFKRCSFALVYGAGAKGIAEQGGVSMAEAQDFIGTFYARYTGVKAWHDDLKERASLKRMPSARKTESGYPAGMHVEVNEHTKRQYVFHEYDAPAFLKHRGMFTSFSPTELKNYMVQGGATGDKVPLMLGYLYRVLRNNPAWHDKAFIINTVHDSILLDVHVGVLHTVCLFVQGVLSDLKNVYEKVFNCVGELPLSYSVEVSVGSNWLDVKPI